MHLETCICSHVRPCCHANPSPCNKMPGTQPSFSHHGTTHSHAPTIITPPIYKKLSTPRKTPLECHNDVSISDSRHSHVARQCTRSWLHIQQECGLQLRRQMVTGTINCRALSLCHAAYHAGQYILAHCNKSRAIQARPAAPAVLLATATTLSSGPRSQPKSSPWPGRYFVLRGWDPPAHQRRCQHCQAPTPRCPLRC